MLSQGETHFLLTGLTLTGAKPSKYYTDKLHRGIRRKVMKAVVDLELVSKRIPEMRHLIIGALKPSDAPETNGLIVLDNE